jgi:hypothetical protein
MKPDVADKDRATLDELAQQTCGIQPLVFVKVTEHEGFIAEYGMEGDDYVFHFFLPSEPTRRNDTEYWLKTFPVVLDVVAREHFQATRPRLRAAYTEEMASWWLRADGYGNVLNKDAFARRFLVKMHQALATTSST